MVEAVEVDGAEGGARKEDMFFDREGEALELVRRAVVERPAGASPLDALHALMRRLLGDGYPLIAVSPGVRVFWRTVEASPTLRARAREVFDAIEARTAELLAADAGVAPDDPGAVLAAAMIWAVQRAAYKLGLGALDRGELPDGIRRRQRDAIERGFAQVAHGPASTPYGRATRPPAGRDGATARRDVEPAGAGKQRAGRTKGGRAGRPLTGVT